MVDLMPTNVNGVRFSNSMCNIYQVNMIHKYLHSFLGGGKFCPDGASMLMRLESSKYYSGVTLDYLRLELKKR